MKESKLTANADGEVAVREVKKPDAKYFEDVNRELAEKSAGYERAFEKDINTDALVDKIALGIVMFFTAVLCVFSAVWAVTVHWGYMALAVAALVGFEVSLGLLFRSLNNMYYRQKALKEGQLFCGKMGAVRPSSFGYRVAYTFRCNGEEIVHTCEVSKKALENLQGKYCLFIAYDSENNKSVPVKLVVAA